MKKILIPLLILSALLLWGCPYDSEVPLDEPSIPINKAWYGLWKMPLEEKSYASLEKYSPQDSLSYRLSYNTWTSEHGSYQVKIFKAYLSEINEMRFINIQPEMKMGGNYYLFGISCNATNDTIRLRPVADEGTPKFTDSGSLRKWIAAQMSHKDFFDAEEVFVRVR